MVEGQNPTEGNQVPQEPQKPEVPVSKPVVPQEAPKEIIQEASKASKPKKKLAIKGLDLLIWGLIILLIGSSGYLLAAKTNLEKLNSLLNQQLKRALTEKASMKSELEETIAIKDELQVRVDEAMQEALVLAGQIEEEKRIKDEALAQMEAAVGQMEGLENQVKLERKEKQRLAVTLKNAENKNEKLESDLGQLKLAKKSLEKKLKDALKRRGVKLDKIVVSPKEKAGAPQGRVLVVNREFDFVVVNLGESDGLEVGTALEILSDGQVIGKAEVEKIYGNMSAAVILPGTQKQSLKEGDLVRPL